jgi:hypothetical protein
VQHVPGGFVRAVHRTHDPVGAGVDRPVEHRRRTGLAAGASLAVAAGVLVGGSALGVRGATAVPATAEHPGDRLSCPTDLRAESRSHLGVGEDAARDPRMPVEITTEYVPKWAVTVTRRNAVPPFRQAQVREPSGRRVVDVSVPDAAGDTIAIFRFVDTQSGWQMEQTFECSEIWSHQMGDPRQFVEAGR